MDVCRLNAIRKRNGMNSFDPFAPKDFDELMKMD
jgi:hypothetical protein